MKGVEDIAPADSRRSAITGHSIGIAELSRLLDAVPPHAEPEAYERTAIGDNVLGLATATGRRKRFGSLRRLYLLRPDSIVFRALRDLWAVEEEARPLLAVLCAIATDSVFRASGSVVLATHPGDQVTVSDFLESVEDAFPGAYAASTLQKAADNAYASWQQSGHLERPEGGHKRRRRPFCGPADVAYALLLGQLQDQRGEALFETLWARVLGQPRSQLYEMAFAASQRGMIEYRNAGGVVEVGFRELLRPLEGELF